MEMADSKPEKKEQAWEIKIAKTRTRTSTFLILYFCNVSSYELKTGSPRSLPKVKARVRTRKTAYSREPCYRQRPKKSWFISQLKQLSRRRASGQLRRGSAFANAMISALLPRIRRHRCIQSHAPGSCEGALRAGCLSLHLANACW